MICNISIITTFIGLVKKKLVGRIELPTSNLQNSHSTIELHQRSRLFKVKSKFQTTYYIIIIKENLMLVNCFRCEKQFNKKPSEIKKSKSGNHFCSRSCAAKSNNKGFQRNKAAERTCKTCQGSYRNEGGYRSTSFCPPCREKYQNEFKNLKNKTLREYQEKESVKRLHRSCINNHARGFAKSWNKNLKEQPCQCCGYSKHIEFCHIKAISSFDLDALLGEINSPDNIAILCRNCHWEFDHGELTVEQIPKRK